MNEDQKKDSPINEVEEKLKETLLKKFKESEQWTQEREEELLREFEDRKKINEVINKIEENAKKDISFLLENARHPGETNEEYVIRRKLRNQFEKERKRGYLFHKSNEFVPEGKIYKRKGITYYKVKHEN
mgnify:CR=1 FL=1